MFLSDLRRIAEHFGFRETPCRACPAEDWAPTCSACGGSTRVWVDEEWVLSDERVDVPRRRIRGMKLSALSPMPEGLLHPLTKFEILGPAVTVRVPARR